ncbi:MFS transporter [Candidatus Actinomarina]|jgi:UMF1 family MFS transporter|nr:MFS transporter [Candidatus Actinomarina sp.]
MNNISKRSLYSWLFFDLANTVYAFVIPGLYFSVWLVSEQGWTDQSLGFATSGAMVIVAILGPWVGARSDGSQGKKPMLLITTLICIVATFLLGTFDVSISVLFFIVSLIGFNLGSVVYDALLVSVSTPTNRGRISGLGVAFGYVGSLLGFGVATLLQNFGYSYVEIFRSVAVMFLIFSLPAFIFIKEKKVSNEKSTIKITESISLVIKSWKHSTQYPGLTRFLVGRFFYADAINTLISGLLAVYLVEEVGLSPTDSQNLLGLAIIISIIGGYVFGKAADKYGPRKLTLISLVCWMLSLSVAIIATEFDQLWLIYVTGVLGGFNIGGIFAVDRVFMTRLSPEKHLGEFYGLYSTVGRFATIIGPLLWGLIVNTLGLGRNAALFSLIILLLISFFIIKGVSDEQHVGG